MCISLATALKERLGRYRPEGLNPRSRHVQRSRRPLFPVRRPPSLRRRLVQLRRRRIGPNPLELGGLAMSRLPAPARSLLVPLPRLLLLLSEASPMRSLSCTRARQDPSGRLPAGCKLGVRILGSPALFLIPRLRLGPRQPAVLLGSSERRTSGSWRAAQARPRRSLAGLVSEPASEI